MLKAPIILLFFCVVTLPSFTQNTLYNAVLIAPELKNGVNAVVRNSSMEIIIEDFESMIVKKKIVVTVLNKMGNVDARIAESYDNDTKISGLSAKVYDSFGKEIKKFTKRDFLDISAVEGGTLYSDARVKYVDYTPISYPYTVVFQSEYNTSTTGFIPWWEPINGYYVSVEKSSYSIRNINKIPWRIKKANFDHFAIKATETNEELAFTIENQPGYSYENAAIHYREILPRAIVTLNRFSLKGVEGNYTNWKEFGAWMHAKLLTGRDVLDPATIVKIKDLVKGVESPLEKAKLVYAFMQNKTRYISVQVGIGGWEPIAAKQVDQVGYGDCKGLVNYTKALMAVAGVASYYTIVYADEKRDIDINFPSMQGNHAILNIPSTAVSADRDIWLECTSQTIPFGFLGDFTDDRDVLVVQPEGGFIKRTTAYKGALNLQESVAEIGLSAEGSLTATLEIVSTGLQYYDKQEMMQLSELALTKKYKTEVWSYHNNLDLRSINLKNDKENIAFKENLELSIENYATVNENEYLFRVNVFNNNSFVPKRYRDRRSPLKISRGYRDEDSYVIEIPKSYKFTYIPADKEITTKFGSYTARFKHIDETHFSYKRAILIKEGIYPKEAYKIYRSFRKNIAKHENLRIALTKKTL